jgi:hypothetical protein
MEKKSIKKTAINPAFAGFFYLIENQYLAMSAAAPHSW